MPGLYFVIKDGGKWRVIKVGTGRGIYVAATEDNQRAAYKEAQDLAKNQASRESYGSILVKQANGSVSRFQTYSHSSVDMKELVEVQKTGNVPFQYTVPIRLQDSSETGTRIDGIVGYYIVQESAEEAARAVRNHVF